MKHISILVPAGATALGTIEGPYKLFTTLNSFLTGMGKAARFKVELVGLTSKPQHYDGVFSVTPDNTYHHVKKTDLIIVPAVNGNKYEVLNQNSDFFPWIIDQHENGAEVASLCVGAFLLAGTGLLNGKNCTTHWQSVPDFKQMFPDVNLVADNIVTAENGIYTSGGANSFWNLLLYLTEKYINREMAVLISKYFMLEIDKTSQSPFMMFKGQKSHEDETVKRAQDFIEQNFHEKITIDQLAAMFALGRRNLERRFKKATANTVGEYMQRVKVEAAKMRLEKANANINDVMYKVGYTDSKAFRTIFKKITGLSPIQYRNKFQREVFSDKLA